MEAKEVYGLFEKVMEEVSVVKQDIAGIKVDVSHIKVQTTKTNGRVLELEKQWATVQTWKVAIVVAWTIIALVVGGAAVAVAKSYDTVKKLEIIHQQSGELK